VLGQPRPQSTAASRRHPAGAVAFPSGREVNHRAKSRAAGGTKIYVNLLTFT
jgi:hypothetical protein